MASSLPSFLSDRAIMALTALMINAILGQAFKYIPLLTTWPRKSLQLAERKLNRNHRSLPTRKKRGMLVTFVFLLAALATGIGAMLITSHWLYGIGIEIFLLSLLLPVRESMTLAIKMKDALIVRDITHARELLAGTCWRNYSILDAYALARASIETLLIYFNDKIVSALCCYLLFGLPGIFISRSLTLMVELWNGQAQGFGHMSAKLQAGLHFLPRCLAAYILTLSAVFLPYAKPLAALKTALLHMMNGQSAALALGAGAEILSLSLGGPLSPYLSSQWVGEGTAKAAPRDITRALRLFGLGLLLVLLALGLLTY